MSGHLSFVFCPYLIFGRLFLAHLSIIWASFQGFRQQLLNVWRQLSTNLAGIFVFQAEDVRSDSEDDTMSSATDSNEPNGQIKNGCTKKFE